MNGIIAIVLISNSTYCAGETKNYSGHKVWIYNDLYENIQTGYFNIGISYLFAKNWSTEAVMGVCRPLTGNERNPEKDEHDQELGHRLNPYKKRPVHKEMVSISYWPVKGQESIDINTSLAYDNLSRFSLSLGAGYTIRIAGHLLVRIGISACLASSVQRAEYHNCSIRIGYCF